MRRARVSKSRGDTWWTIKVFEPRFAWLTLPYRYTWPQSMRTADRWTHGPRTTGGWS